MSKIRARIILISTFMIYLLSVFVPITVFLDLLRWAALPPGATFTEVVWTGIVDPLSILIITALNCILTWLLATRMNKVIKRLMKGPYTRALEALKSED